MKNRLMLMAGQTRRPGWKTLDSRGGVDFLCRIPPLPEAVRRDSWDEIELIHGIGQLYPWEAETLLRDIRDVLRPGALLVLEQPNFDIICGSKSEAWIYGDPKPRDPLRMVKWGYSPYSLTRLLAFCGFTRIETQPAQHLVPARDFRIEARV